MNMKNLNTSDQIKHGHSHAKHILMMVIFCGVPIIGFLIFSLIGTGAPILEKLLLVVCVVGMIGMMIMMHRDSKAEEIEQSRNQSGNGNDYEASKE